MHLWIKSLVTTYKPIVKDGLLESGTHFCTNWALYTHVHKIAKATPVGCLFMKENALFVSEAWLHLQLCPFTQIHQSVIIHYSETVHAKRHWDQMVKVPDLWGKQIFVSPKLIRARHFSGIALKSTIQMRHWDQTWSKPMRSVLLNVHVQCFSFLLQRRLYNWGWRVKEILCGLRCVVPQPLTGALKLTLGLTSCVVVVVEDAVRPVEVVVALFGPAVDGALAVVGILSEVDGVVVGVGRLVWAVTEPPAAAVLGLVLAAELSLVTPAAGYNAAPRHTGAMEGKIRR